ncbi:uncharacterized protein LOC5509011 [Nematostella vectensis]|uniref:uncharacterized protein LOC5509011 n=1 Tax=Nematostella vectensis TaxID=45351 RepID=UPI002076E7B3|nr:uncharacterized protein LOC5509011 [Nematostella vectensis]
MDLMGLLATLACILVTFHQAQSLRCLKCFSYKSMEDCGRLQTSEECGPGYDRCQNTTVEVYVEMMKERITGYSLGCARSMDCHENRCANHFGIQMGQSKYIRCDIRCCGSDHCPEGKNATYLTPPPTVVGGQPNKGARSGADSAHASTIGLSAVVVMTTSLFNLLLRF